MSKVPQSAERGSFWTSAFRRDSVWVFFQKVNGSGGHLPDQRIDAPLAISSLATEDGSKLELSPQWRAFTLCLLVSVPVRASDK